MGRCNRQLKSKDRKVQEGGPGSEVPTGPKGRQEPKDRQAPKGRQEPEVRKGRMESKVNRDRRARLSTLFVLPPAFFPKAAPRLWTPEAIVQFRVAPRTSFSQ